MKKSPVGFLALWLQEKQKRTPSYSNYEHSMRVKQAEASIHDATVHAGLFDIGEEMSWFKYVSESKPYRNNREQ